MSVRYDVTLTTWFMLAPCAASTRLILSNPYSHCATRSLWWRMFPRGPFSSSAPTPARKIIVPRPKPFTVTASEKMPFVQALWVNSFFSNAGAGGCCAATGVTTRHTTAVAITAAKLRMGTSSGLANGVQSSHPRAFGLRIAASRDSDQARRMARTCGRPRSGRMLMSDLLLNDAGMSAGFSPRRSKPVAGGGADAQRRGFGFTHDLFHVICDKLAAAFDDAPVDQDSVDVGGTGPHHHGGLDIRDGRDIGSLLRIRMRSARLPTVSDPVTSSMPSALAPLSVAISMASRNVISGMFSDGVPRHGMPRFQVTRVVSNILSGAIDVASNDSEINTP